MGEDKDWGYREWEVAADDAQFEQTQNLAMETQRVSSSELYCKTGRD